MTIAPLSHDVEPMSSDTSCMVLEQETGNARSWPRTASSALKRP